MINFDKRVFIVSSVATGLIFFFMLIMMVWALDEKYELQEQLKREKSSYKQLNDLYRTMRDADMNMLENAYSIRRDDVDIQVFFHELNISTDYIDKMILEYPSIQDFSVAMKDIYGANYLYTKVHTIDEEKTNGE